MSPQTDENYFDERPVTIDTASVAEALGIVDPRYGFVSQFDYDGVNKWRVTYDGIPFYSAAVTTRNDGQGTIYNIFVIS